MSSTHEVLQPGKIKLILILKNNKNQIQSKIMDEPKTRREKKGRDKQNPSSVYSSKHVREQERLQEKRRGKNMKNNNNK